jgi:hypothetical protein
VAASSSSSTVVSSVDSPDVPSSSSSSPHAAATSVKQMKTARIVQNDPRRLCSDAMQLPQVSAVQP